MGGEGGKGNSFTLFKGNSGPSQMTTVFLEISRNLCSTHAVPPSDTEIIIIKEAL